MASQDSYTAYVKRMKAAGKEVKSYEDWKTIRYKKTKPKSSYEDAANMSVEWMKRRGV